MEHFDVIVVFVVLAFILISLYKELLGAAFTFFVAVMVLGFFGVLTPKELLAGFANEQIAVIIMLLLLGDAIRQISVIEIFFSRIFPRQSGYRGFLSRIMLWIGGFSAFLNNTPLVAVMMPYVHNWSKRNNISPSKLLLPLSYAAILGGCVTLIGTSTNLIVNGMVIDQTIFPDMEPLHMFDFFWVGFPMLVIGFLYLFFFGDKLLPKHSILTKEISGSERKYVVEAKVHNNSKLVGKSIEDSGFANSKGLFLAEVVRKKYTFQVFDKSFILEAGDLLRFAGESEDIANLLSDSSNLSLPSVGMMSRLKRADVVEIVISHNSTLISKMVKDINFRSKYDSVLLAIHRNGERITGKLEEIKLKAGDVILLLAGDDFNTRSQDDMDFYLISKVKEVRKPERYKIWTLFGGTLLAIFLSALNLIPLFMGLLVVLVVINILGVVNAKDLPKSIDYNLAVIIALSLALGTAMIKTGVADMIANFMISILFPFGKVAVLTGIYLITSILAAYITNKAAVAIIFPISLTAAHSLQLNPLPFALVVSFAAAANFLTPIGYQTNLMVYGPGGYTFKDFFRIGWPLTLIYMVVTVAILNYMYL
ncbi:SLC13 family permease [Plebeiibacterium sediminum]|uniref:SLC13 family permease n=1 Tax=Plebeiibacterium sediminum TaxID=2992112 RepID=A0AAE3M5K8_9BACT|nr:SLC13 family permease [Plebeiobacterium sediminum]MCW3787582.1 SLC13 family permease [Plebeiobacterium sediminum]